MNAAEVYHVWWLYSVLWYASLAAVDSDTWESSCSRCSSATMKSEALQDSRHDVKMRTSKLT